MDCPNNTDKVTCSVEREKIELEKRNKILEEAIESLNQRIREMLVDLKDKS